MNQEQLSREIADFAFWQQTQNECDRGYVRSGNRVMRKSTRKVTGKGDTMSTHELEASLQREFMRCPECNEDTHTVAAEGVPAQALRGCKQCGAAFFMDLSSTPRYEAL